MQLLGRNAHTRMSLEVPQEIGRLEEVALPPAPAAPLVRGFDRGAAVRQGPGERRRVSGHTRRGAADIHQQPTGSSPDVVPILSIKKLRFRDIVKWTQSHKAHTQMTKLASVPPLACKVGHKRVGQGWAGDRNKMG